ncbi:hypothetical protein GALMADRAFT_158383 [Galerina marginata CBS 339.88]|uniref:F-box domain-containing protein n=1 Tax=Galerina marginata (strain CBS 339.88) TaxID=685588 RepID=A0A067SQQ8_GALM3|nr:hypothetical protein GALMADRAFT_158383 [Galerina marginata CBS 339.88]
MENHIFKLDRDVIWNVFLINADMECIAEHKVPAVHTLRHTSQVCSAWRDLTLSSPSLWARVINFDFLRGEGWRKEVLNRTGRSPLSVRGDTDQEVIIPLLAENWSRIRYLNLAFLRSAPEKFRQDTDLWHLLARPATVLESFQLSLHVLKPEYWEPDQIVSPPDFTIFDNHAPLLKHFSTSGINPNIGADWSLQLRHLALSIPIPVHELLEALSHLRLLETFVSHAIIRGDAERSRTLPKISLPQLKNIRIYSTMDITPNMIFLAQIEPVQGRVLTFDTDTKPNSPDGYISDLRPISVTSKVLSMYSNQAGLGASTQLTLQLYEFVFGLSGFLPARRQFRFSLGFHPRFRGDDTLSQLLSALYSPIFHHTRTLKLYVGEGCGLSPIDPNFINCIASFPSLDILYTDSTTLDFLLRLPEDVLKSAFPVMREIQMRSLLMYEIAPVRTFIHSRSVLGVPISILTVNGTEWWNSENSESLEECFAARLGIGVPAGTR